jgi:hypothetical protein
MLSSYIKYVEVEEERELKYEVGEVETRKMS